MVKKFIKIFGIFLAVNLFVCCNISLAESPNTAIKESSDETIIINEEVKNVENNNTDQDKNNMFVEVNTENVEEKIGEAADTVSNFAYVIVYQISDKCLPVCAILILWGAVMYFIMGIRNLYKKRQGLLLMWGAFTFVVIAKIINFLFWFALVR